MPTKKSFGGALSAVLAKLERDWLPAVITAADATLPLKVQMANIHAIAKKAKVSGYQLEIYRCFARLLLQRFLDAQSEPTAKILAHAVSTFCNETNCLDRREWTRIATAIWQHHRLSVQTAAAVSASPTAVVSVRPTPDSARRGVVVAVPPDEIDIDEQLRKDHR